MKTGRTFGVEIELNGTMYRSTKKPGFVQNVYPRTLRYTERQFYPSNFWEFELEPGWKFVVDTTCGIEFVSPPLCDTESVRKMVDVIKQSPIVPEFSTSGLHVHVGAQDFRKPDLLNMAKFCRHFDRAIFSFTDKDRIKNVHCRPVQQSDEQLSNTIVSGLAPYDRYKGCNIASYVKHGTIEFRYARSTLKIARIESFIDLFISIADFVIKNEGRKVKSPRKTADKRKFLLDLVGVRPQSKFILLHG